MEQPESGPEKTLDQFTAYIDKAIDGLSSAVKQSTSSLGHASSEALSEFKNLGDIGAAHLQQADEQLITTLKRGVLAARENEVATASALGLLALSLPGPRRLLWRVTLGRLRSAEAAEKSAEARFSVLTEAVEKQATEVAGTQQQLAQAREEWVKSQAKVKGAAANLRSLAARVGSTEKSARGENGLTLMLCCVATNCLTTMLNGLICVQHLSRTFENCPQNERWHSGLKRRSA
jgi:hypothetical protein